jgi:hypothetical protein
VDTGTNHIESTGSEFYVSDRGSQRDAASNGDATYMLSANTNRVTSSFHLLASRFRPAMLMAADGPRSEEFSFFKPIFEDQIPVLIPRMS